MVELQFQKKIKALQTDAGKEYLAFSTSLKDHGIIHRLSCPYTHEQNGSPERKHRHIIEIGLTLLAESGLSFHYWNHAFACATFVINRLPTPVLKMKSPFEVLFHRTPDYNLFKSFGCRCYPYLRPYNRHKMDYRSQPCIFLGYSSQHKGYKCLSDAGKIYITRHVIFDELQFPKHNNITSMAANPNPQTFSNYMPVIPLIHNAVNMPANSIIPQHIQNTIEHATESSIPASITNVSLLSPSSVQSTLQPSTNDPSTVATNDHATSTQDPGQPAPLVNTHPMVTRAKAGIFKPKSYLTETEPLSVKDALQSPHWLAAMQDELQALTKNKTWDLVPLPPNRKAIGSKWVYKIKQNSDGSISKYKARLVAKGYNQQEGLDYKDTFSPIVKHVTIRTILSIALSKGWTIRQVDINNAFLNGPLQEEVYVKPPEGFFNKNPGLVCRLKKAIHGLKQAPRAWFSKLASTLISFGFKSARCDNSLFIHYTSNSLTYMLIYVDDILITGNNSAFVQHIIHKLNSLFPLKDLGHLSYFLGIETRELSSGQVLLT